MMMKPSPIKGYSQSCVIHAKLQCKTLISPLEPNRRPSNQCPFGDTWRTRDNSASKRGVKYENET